MVAIPQWVLGRNISSVVITPQSVNASTGVLSDTTPVGYFVSRWKNIRIRSNNDLENIQSSDVRRKNMVPVQTGTRLEVTEIPQIGAVDANPTNPGAAAAYGTADYFKYTITRSGKTFTGYGVVESYEESYNGPSAGEATLVFEMIDPGAANPGYA